MVTVQEDPQVFIRKLVGFQERIIIALRQAPNVITACADDWEVMQRQINGYEKANRLCPVIRQVAQAVAQNVESIVSFAMILDQEKEKGLETLTQELHNLRFNPRQIANSTTQQKDHARLSPSLSSCSSMSSVHQDREHLPYTIRLNLTPADHLRLWFLNHLANPYPTPSEKDQLSRLTGIARNKIDSDMTNWRRRAGWTDIKEKWARGSKAEMVALIERVEMGEEKRKAVNEAVEKMKAYLERREEYGVGSWVHQLKTMAKDRLDETPRKKARVEGKKKIERPITPPFSTNSTPTSSVYSTRSFTSSDPSPAGSSRSTSSSSSISTSYSFNDFKPYSFELSASLPISTSPLTPVSSTAGTVAGVKRENEFGDHMSSNTRRKLESVSPVVDQLPFWSAAGYAESYSDELYIPPLPEPIAPIVWTASAPLPEYLPHMTATPRQLPAFTLPDQHDFSFSVPTSEARRTA